MKTRGCHGLLVPWWCASLFCSNEAGADPNGTRTKRDSHGKPSAVEDATSRDDVNVFACEWALRVLAKISDNGYEDRRRYFTRVAASLATLMLLPNRHWPWLRASASLDPSISGSCHRLVCLVAC